MSETLSNQTKIRNASEKDVPFIFNSWLKSFKSSVFATQISPLIYFENHHKIIEELLKICKVSIICSSQDESQIFGYMVSQKIEEVNVVHYIYIKEPYRKLGLAKHVLNYNNIKLTEAFFYTHKTKLASVLDKKYKLIYNPYLSFCNYLIESKNVRNN